MKDHIARLQQVTGALNHAFALASICPKTIYSSTLHRALHIGNGPRISAAFFVYPDATTVVRCIDTCQRTGESAKIRRRYDSGICARAARGCASHWGRPAVTIDTAQRLRSN